MRAVVWQGSHNVEVDEVEDVKLVEPTDVLVRPTTAAICGSDLHMYEGRAPGEPGMVFGHENLGVVSEVGDAVRTVQVGDRVVLPFNISCGFCFNCTRGFTNACLTTNPNAHGGGFGYSGMGPHRGGQAEQVRVPYGDFNCLKLPGRPGDEWEDDFVLLADIFPTGYHATEQAHVRPGDTSPWPTPSRPSPAGCAPQPSSAWVPGPGSWAAICEACAAATFCGARAGSWSWSRGDGDPGPSRCVPASPGSSRQARSSPTTAS